MIEHIPYLFLFLHLIAAETVFLIKAEKRSYFWIRFAASLVVGGVASYFVQYITFLDWGAFFIPLLLGFAVILISYKISVFHAVLFSVLAYALQNCAFNISTLIFSSFGEVNVDSIYLELISLAVFALILIGCWFLAVRNRDYKSIFGIKNIGMMCVCFVVLTLIIVLHSNFNAETAETIGRVFLIISVGLSVFLIFGISSRSRLSKEKAEIEQLLKKEENLHRLSKENIDMINMKCHDLKHRIAAIGGEKDDLSDVREVLDIYDSFIKTGNEDLDIVIAEKTLYCKKYGILLSCIIDGRQLSFMSSGDVYSLFGNAFDNAVECLKTQPEEKRIISLSVQIKGKFLGVRMENYCGKKLEFSGGLPVTDKPDKDYHGFGMKSMRYITEKYDGSLLAEQRGDMFVLSIMFPKNEKNSTLQS